jgi:two-component system chemotaxis response regulator CheY
VRVLLADDAAVARAILARLVADAGHEVVGEAQDAPTTLERCAALRPDAVVVDGRLPPDGALAVVPRLRALDPALRILVTAGLDDLEFLRAAVAAGASAGLERPFLSSKVEAAFALPARTG